MRNLLESSDVCSGTAVLKGPVTELHDHVLREHLAECEDDDSSREYDWIPLLHPYLSVLGSP